MIKGHAPCAEVLEQLVSDVLLNTAQLDHHAQRALLAEVEPVFTEDDDDMFETLPTK